MTVLDNFLANQSKVLYTSYFNADKIAVYSSKTDSSGIGAGGSLAVVAATPPDNSITVATIANPYGRKCLPTMSWSLDDTNFYPMNIPIYYYNATFQEYLWQALGFMGCSDSLIYICCTTAYGSAQTMYVQFALDSPT